VQGNSFHTFRFSAYEVVAAMVSLSTMAVGITLWSMTTFQTKESGLEHKIQIEKRLDLLEMEMRVLKQGIHDVARDVSWIRGKLEIKQKGD
jgi:hypothetical protein